MRLILLFFLIFAIGVAEIKNRRNEADGKLPQVYHIIKHR